MPNFVSNRHDDDIGGGVFQSSVGLSNLSAGTYLVRVGGWNGSSGTFTVRAQFNLAGDACGTITLK